MVGTLEPRKEHKQVLDALKIFDKAESMSTWLASVNRLDGGKPFATPSEATPNVVTNVTSGSKVSVTNMGKKSIPPAHV